jgi:hypothetical protein
LFHHLQEASRDMGEPTRTPGAWSRDSRA